MTTIYYYTHHEQSTRTDPEDPGRILWTLRLYAQEDDEPGRFKGPFILELDTEATRQILGYWVSPTMETVLEHAALLALTLKRHIHKPHDLNGLMVDFWYQDPERDLCQAKSLLMD